MVKHVLFQILGVTFALASSVAGPSEGTYFCSYAVRGELGDAPTFPFVQETIREVREVRMPDLKSSGEGSFTYFDDLDRVIYLYAREGRLTISISKNSDSSILASVEYAPTDSIRIEEAGDGDNFLSCTFVDPSLKGKTE